jgi:hypothetical protein
MFIPESECKGKQERRYFLWHSFACNSPLFGLIWHKEFQTFKSVREMDKESTYYKLIRTSKELFHGGFFVYEH